MSQPSKLAAAILAHLATLSIEDAAKFYGMPEKTLKGVIRTKKPTAKMMEVFIENPPEQEQQEPSPPENEQPGPAAAALPTDDLLNHPIIKAMVEKINEIAMTLNGEVIPQLEGDALRIGELETVVLQALQGSLSAAAAPVAGAVPVLSTPRDGGFTQPELIGSIRPGRSPVSLVSAPQPAASFPAAPASAPVVGHVPPPVPAAQRRVGILSMLATAPTAADVAAQTHQVDTGSIKEGTAFDWLRPHATRK
jgi:hypothetical protein